MNKADCYKEVISKGGKILEKRTKYKEIKIGDQFQFKGQPSWKKRYTVLFFYRDKVFDYTPFVCGWCEEEKEMILLSYSHIELLNEYDDCRERRPNQNLRGLFK